MNTEALEELQRLSDAASPGPWTLGEMGPPIQVAGTPFRPTAPQVWHGGFGAPVATLDGRAGAPEKDEADARFIVAAVNYVRAMLDGEPEDSCYECLGTDGFHRDGCTRWEP